MVGKWPHSLLFFSLSEIMYKTFAMQAYDSFNSVLKLGSLVLAAAAALVG